MLMAGDTRKRKAQLSQQEGGMKRKSTTLPLKLNDVIAGNDLQAADAWVKAHSEDFAADEVLTEFKSVTNAAMNDRSPESTRRLFRLRMVLERFLSRSLDGALSSIDERGLESLISLPHSDTSIDSDLIQLLRKLEEDAVGPKFAGPRQPQAVFARVYNFRGCRLAENGHYVEAIDHFTTALGLEDTFVPALCNRARSWIERGETDRAAKDCRRMTELDPDYKPGRETVAMVETLGRFQSERGGTLLELAHEHGLLELLRRYDRPRLPGETLQAAMRQPGGSIADEQAPRNPGRTPSE